VENFIWFVIGGILGFCVTFFGIVPLAITGFFEDNINKKVTVNTDGDIYELDIKKLT